MAKRLSTYERKLKSTQFKKAFKKSYKDLLFSELMIAIMEKDETSVRKLAREAHLSASVIQDLRTGKQRDIKVRNFIRVVHALGYEIILKRGSEHFILQDINQHIVTTRADKHAKDKNNT